LFRSSLDVDNDWVTVHVGLKSEGVISLDEFRNNEGKVEVNVGDEVEVALEAVEMVTEKLEFQEKKQEDIYLEDA
jgi:ribosomal protein S1